MWKIPSGDSKVYLGNGEKAEGAKLMPDGKRVIVGYGDGSMRLFDLKSGDVLHNLTDGTTSHSPAAVTALDTRSDNNLIASGGADGIAKIFNVQSGKNIGMFVHGKSGQSSSSEESEGKSTVEALLFSPTDKNLLVSGTLDGHVSVWDVSSQIMKHSTSVGDGVVKMSWRNNGANDQIFAATLHGIVAIVDVKTGKVIGECSGHKDAVLDFSQTADGNHILSCSDDGHCRIFDVNKIIAASSSSSD